MENYFLSGVTILIFVLLFLSFISKETRHAILEICKQRFSKIVASALVLLLALVAFIFGIHADIFSSYDKFSSRLDRSYNWFSPYDIVSFPIDQYKLNKHIFHENTINIDTLFISGFSRKVSIVIDKTSSTIPDTFTKRISRGLRERLVGNLQASSQNELPLKYDSISVEDLLVMSSIRLLALDKSIKTNIEIFFYWGNGKFTSTSDKDELLDPDDFNSLIRRYYETLNNGIQANRGINHNTNFGNIAGKLVQPCSFGDTSGADTTFRSLFVVSDFAHEQKSGTSFADLRTRFDSLGNNFKINQVTLIRLKGADNNPADVAETINIFRENFNDLFFYNFNEDQTFMNVSPDEIVASMFFSTKDDPRFQALYLYYLWSNENPYFDYEGELTLGNRHQHIAIELRDRNLTSEIDGVSGFLLLPNERAKLYPHKMRNISTTDASAKSIKLITDNLRNKNFTIGLSIPNRTLRVVEPIILREVLPISSCLYLVMFYLVATIILTLLIVYLLIQYNIIIHHRIGTTLYDSNNNPLETTVEIGRNDVLPFRCFCYFSIAILLSLFASIAFRFPWRLLSPINLVTIIMMIIVLISSFVLYTNSLQKESTSSHKPNLILQ